MLGGGEEELQGAHLFLHGLGAHHGLEEDHLVPLEGAHHLHHGHSHARLDLRLVGASITSTSITGTIALWGFRGS